MIRNKKNDQNKHLFVAYEELSAAEKAKDYMQAELAYNLLID